MSDPVTVSTGQTYDRSSIESWIATGNTTCPVTRVSLSDFILIPNHTLRRLIQNWCVSNRSFGVELCGMLLLTLTGKPSLVQLPLTTYTYTQTTCSAYFSSFFINSTVKRFYHFETRLSAIHRLRGLARDSEKNRSPISSHNPQIPLLSIFFSDSEKNELIYESLTLVVMFQLSESECNSTASQSDRIQFLSSLLSHPSTEVRVNSAALIEILATGTRSIDLRILIGNADGLIEGIIGLNPTHGCISKILKFLKRVVWENSPCVPNPCVGFNP
ncbi:hypothetical protein MKX01_004160 [Papaver californicum]|nr:hypothetical protein MKX01_004160 [Papaver californicum]